MVKALTQVPALLNGLNGNQLAGLVADQLPFAKTIKAIAAIAGEKPIESLFDTQEGQLSVLKCLMESQGLGGVLNPESLLSMKGSQASTLLSGYAFFKKEIKESFWYDSVISALQAAGDRSLTEALQAPEIRTSLLTSLMSGVSIGSQHSDGTPVYAYSCKTCSCRFLICSSDRSDLSAERDFVSCPECSATISARPGYGRAHL